MNASFIAHNVLVFLCRNYFVLKVNWKSCLLNFQLTLALEVECSLGAVIPVGSRQHF